VTVRLLHPGCLALGWDGELVAIGLGHLWRRRGDSWTAEPPRPLHGVHHQGPRRRVEALGGYVYTDGSRGWRATARLDGDEVLPHPSGAVAFARDGVVHRAGRPGRSPVDIPEILADSLRFAADGAQLVGLGAEGGVRVDLATGRSRAVPGVPIGIGVGLVDGSVLRWEEGRDKPVVLATGLVEASPAYGAAQLAGPGGRLWSLADGAPSQGAPVTLGATAAVGQGFATVPFEGGEGLLVDADGRVAARFPVVLAPDDLVVRLEVRGGRLLGHTAWARTVPLLDVDAPDHDGRFELARVDTPLGPLDDALFPTRSGTIKSVLRPQHFARMRLPAMRVGRFDRRPAL
jgi:hypothetical protein